MPKLTLVFADGDSARVDVRTDETLLGAAKRSGIALASDCEVGDCQTCRARVTAGAAVYDEYASVSLTADEIASGEVLTCAATAIDDVTVTLPYDRAHLVPVKPFTLKIERVERICASVVQLVARSTARAPLAFLPGQYVNLKVPGSDQWRSYSMANAPGGDGTSEFLVRILGDGVMSRYLTERAASGDTIEAKGPYGTFYRRVSAKPMLMVAGGTGLAPMVSMLRTMIALGDRRSVVLCFGVTRAQDVFYLKDLQNLVKAIPLLELHVAVMKGDAAPHASGTAVDLIRAEDVAGRDVYLCGPPAMTDNARTVLIKKGATTDSIFLERFVPVGDDNSAGVRQTVASLSV